MKITSDFPGGNIIYKGTDKKDGITEVCLEQDIRDTEGWWFYWNFRVDEPPERKIRFCFQNKEVVCPYGAAVSENGIDWQFDTSTYEDGTHFSYTFDGSGKSRYFAFSLPYQLSHFESFYASISAKAEKKTLAVSEKGREIPLLVFGSGKTDVVFTARHHCCESTASYALEGVISALLEKHPDALKKYRFHVIPFVDIDGAENGDQGKSRKPHDHNRDYSANPIYNSVRAICDYAKTLDTAAFIDFHSPWKWGGANSRPHIHLLSYENDPNEKEGSFVSYLKEITNKPGFGGIKYDGYVNYLGSSVNKPDAETADNFFAESAGAGFSLTIETPYSGDLVTYTPELLRQWGENIAEALCSILD